MPVTDLIIIAILLISMALYLNERKDWYDD